MIFETEMNLDLLAGEHAECLTRIDGHIERLVSVLTISFFIQNGDLFHLIDAVVFDDPCSRIKGHHVVVLIVPCHCKWADNIISSTMSVHALLGDIILEIQEPDLPIA